MAENGATILVMKIITIVVAVLMISTVALPVIEDAGSDLKTVGQNTDMTYHAFTPADDGLNLSISGGVVTVGTETITLTKYSQIMIAENFGISAAPNDNSFVITVDGGYASANSVSVNTTGITYTGGSQTFGDYAFIMSNHGDYGIFSGGDTVKFNADTVLYLAGDYTPTNADASPTQYAVAFGASGTYDSLTSTFIRNITDGDVTGTVTAVLNVTEDPHGYYSCTVDSTAASVVFTTAGNVQYSIEAGTPRLIAPVQYLYTSDTDAGMLSLIGVIPILLILIPVMMAVRMMTLKRN